MHSGLKQVAEFGLRYGGPAHLARLRARGRALILGYHNVVPDGAVVAGDRSLHLPQERFAEQLDLLVRYCRVVPLETVLDAADQADPRPRVAVTFDDAYAGTLTLGVEELSRRGLPATVFVAPGFVGGGRAFWWDALAEPGSQGPAPEVRRRSLAEFGGSDSVIRRWAEAAAVPSHAPAPFATVASEEELQAAARFPLLTLASHTWSHPNLSSLGDAELRAELERPLAWLRDRFPRVIPWLAYPYGISSPAAARAAAATYRAAVRISGGWLPRHPADPFALPRLNVPAGLSANGFVLRISALVAA